MGRKAYEDALEGVTRANPVAKELIAELQSLSPRPDQIMSADDIRAIERLRPSPGDEQGRTQRLADRTKQLGPDLPGDTGAELGKKLGGAIDQMGNADERMSRIPRALARPRARPPMRSRRRADRARSAARQARKARSTTSPLGSQAPTSTAPPNGSARSSSMR